MIWKRNFQQEQAEHLWGFYADYRRQEARIKKRGNRRNKKKKSAINYRGESPDMSEGKQWDAVQTERKKLVAAQEKCGYFYQDGKLFSRAEIKPAVTYVEAYKKSYAEAVGARNQFDGQLLGLVARDPEVQNTLRKIKILWGIRKPGRFSGNHMRRRKNSAWGKKEERANYGFLKHHLYRSQK